MTNPTMPDHDAAEAIQALAELIARIVHPYSNGLLTRSAVETALVSLGYDESAVRALTRGGER